MEGFPQKTGGSVADTYCQDVKGKPGRIQTDSQNDREGRRKAHNYLAFGSSMFAMGNERYYPKAAPLAAHRARFQREQN